MHVHVQDLLPARCLGVSHIIFPSCCPFLLPTQLAVGFGRANYVLFVKMALIFTFILTNLLLEIIKRTHQEVFMTFRHSTDVGQGIEEWDIRKQ